MRVRSLVCVLLLGLGSCASKRSDATVEELTIRGGLGGAALAAEGLAVVGVTSARRELAPLEREQLAEVLREALRAPAGAAIVPAETVALRLPPGAHDALLDGHRRTGALDVAELEALRAALPDVRYAALARIETDFEERVPYTKYVAPSFEWETPRGETAPELRTYRDVTIAVAIYDLVEQAASFTGRVRQRSWTSKQAQATSVAESWSATFTPEYVAPPTLAEVTRDGFARLARELD